MDAILNALINNAPGMGGMVLLVILFLRAQEKKDQQFADMLEAEKDSQHKLAEQYQAIFSSQREALNLIASQLKQLSEFMASHDSWERAVSGEIQDNLRRNISRKLKAVRKQ